MNEMPSSPPCFFHFLLTPADGATVPHCAGRCVLFSDLPCAVAVAFAGRLWGFPVVLLLQPSPRLPSPGSSNSPYPVLQPAFQPSLSSPRTPTPAPVLWIERPEGVQPVAVSQASSSPSSSLTCENLCSRLQLLSLLPLCGQRYFLKAEWLGPFPAVTIVGVATKSSHLVGNFLCNLGLFPCWLSPAPRQFACFAVLLRYCTLLPQGLCTCSCRLLESRLLLSLCGLLIPFHPSDLSSKGSCP